MILIVEKGGLAQVENDESSSLYEEKFKERIFQGMKENLIFSILSFLWNISLDNISSTKAEKEKMQKDFFLFWKKNINEITQEQIKEINKVLNEENIDMINIITGTKQIADVEDYQDIINSCLKEIETIFWKISGKET